MRRVEESAGVSLRVPTHRTPWLGNVQLDGDGRLRFWHIPKVRTPVGVGHQHSQERWMEASGPRIS